MTYEKDPRQEESRLNTTWLSLLLPIHLPSKKLVKGWGLLHRFIQQLDAMESRHWVSFWHRASAGCYERDAQYLVLPALERVHSFWLTDHYGSDKQAQTSLNIVLDEYDKLAKACPYPPMTIVNTVMVKGLPNRYLRIYIYRIYHCVYV